MGLESLQRRSFGELNLSASGFQWMQSVNKQVKLERLLNGKPFYHESFRRATPIG